MDDAQSNKLLLPILRKELEADDERTSDDNVRAS